MLYAFSLLIFTSEKILSLVSFKQNVKTEGHQIRVYQIPRKLEHVKVSTLKYEVMFP